MCTTKTHNSDLNYVGWNKANRERERCKGIIQLTSAVTACISPLYDILQLNLLTAIGKSMLLGGDCINLRCWLSTSSSTALVKGPGNRSISQ